MESSYKSRDIDYAQIFKMLVKLYKPQKIVEFGILNGYSLQIFADSASKDSYIEAYDIFDEFDGNRASKDIIAKFSSYPNVSIAYGDFYKKYAEIDDESIDLLHIDIANNGDVYKFAIEIYMPKIRRGGFIVLEGGSLERDNMVWMVKYNKPKITPVLKDIREQYVTCTMGIMPSITIIQCNTLILRELEPADYHKGFVQLINYFTQNIKVITFEQFSAYIELIKNQGGMILVVEENNRIIGTGKLLIEYKLHNNLCKIGHIEDVVIDPTYRRKGFGRKITKKLIEHAKNANAYKIVLNCDEKGIPFYEKCGFVKKGYEMSIYFH